MHPVRALGNKMRLLWAFLKLNDFWKNHEKIENMEKITKNAEFFKKSKNFKNTYSCHILSLEALISLVLKLVLCWIITKWKKWSLAVLDPLNMTLFEARKCVFSKFDIDFRKSRFWDPNNDGFDGSNTARDHFFHFVIIQHSTSFKTELIRASSDRMWQL